MKEGLRKFLVASVFIFIALLSLAYTVYNYLKYPENRERFVERLKNARTTNLFHEMREMRMKKGGEDANER
ncbi:MAG: hypothetical protein GXO04_00645 [Aquificae bacterium]|nr:hypothetical protein [Aquificota bacterium]